MCKSYITAFIIAACLSLTSQAQNPLSPGNWEDIRVDRLSSDQGLSQVTVLAILQDRNGFLWLGTQYGLNRYDGYGMRVFIHKADDSLSIGGNFIYALYEDRQGNIWIGTRDNGVSCYNPQTEQFKRYQHIPGQPNSLSDNFVHAIIEDQRGIIWIGTWNGGLNALNPKTGAFTHYLPDAGDPNTLSSETVTGIAEDKNGALWITTFSGGLCRLDPDRKTFTRFMNDPGNPNSLQNNRVISIYKDPSEKEEVFWLGTIDGGLNRFDVATRHFKAYKKQEGNPNSISSNRIHGICADPNDPRYLWLATWDKGLGLFDKKTARFKSFGFDPQRKEAISGQMLFNIVADRTGNIWIGSQGGGLNKIDPMKQVIGYWSTDSQGSYKLEHNEIQAICEERSGKGLWISTKHGGMVYLPKTGGARQVYKTLPGQPYDLDDYEVNVIVDDRNGNLWMGASGLGLFVRKSGSNQFEYVNLLGKPLTEKSARVDLRTAFEDRTGVIWAGSLGKGLFRYDPKSDSLVHFQHNPAVAGSLSSNDVLAIGHDAAGNLWVGSRSGGLNRYNSKTGRFTHYKNDPNRSASLINNSVNGIVSPSQYPQLLILATAGGVNLLDLGQPLLDDPAKAEFIPIVKHKELTDLAVYDILEDQQGRFWASTTKGLFVLTLQKNGDTYQMKVVQHYDKSDGLQSDEFNLGASYKNASGDLYFGGVKGMNLIRPQLMTGMAPEAPVVFTLFEKYDKSGDYTGAIPVPGISHLEQIVLSHTENIFAVEFAALHFKNASKINYAYQLEGESDNWIELGQRRRLTFANLAPGHYTLRVKSTYHNGPWSEPTATLRIIIRPPWWRSTAAWVVYALLLGAAGYLARRYERNRMQTKNELQLQAARTEQLREIDRLKSEFFANISHEFRTPLTLIIGPLEQLLSGSYKGNTQQEYTLMKSNAQRLQKLIDQLLDLSKLDAGKLDMHKKNEDIVGFARQIVSAFQPLAEKGRIQLDFQAEAPALPLDFDPEQMEKILFNLLSNAFKFTPAQGRIWLQIEKTSDDGSPAVCIRVGDNGQGISPGSLPFVFDRFYKSKETSFEAGTGIGLALTKELVTLHGGKIDVQSEPGQGAVFRILLPMTQSAPKSELPVAVSPAPVSDDWLGARHLEDETAVSAGNDALPLVLVVEDNVEMSDYIQRNLSDSYRIITAFDGQKGLRLAQDTIPDLIISDLMMPEMNGYELCKKIKTDQYCSHIPVILLTAKASGGSRIEGLQAGADDYLVKPFNVRELKARVNNLIAQRTRLRTLMGSALKSNTGGTQVLSKADAALMERLVSIIDDNLSDENFDVDQLARKAGFSRAQLYRKIKALTDQPVSEYIQMLRLKRAAELIIQQSGNLTEVAYMVGFKDPSYFSKCFRKQYDCLPSEYLEKLR